MAEERNTENFALGIIVAAIVFLLLRRELGKRKETDHSVQPLVTAPSCCGGVAAVQAPSTNPGVSIGGESYSILPFKQSSVTPFMANSPTPGKQWVTH